MAVLGVILWLIGIGLAFLTGVTFWKNFDKFLSEVQRFRMSDFTKLTYKLFWTPVIMLVSAVAYIMIFSSLFPACFKD